MRNGKVLSALLRYAKALKLNFLMITLIWIPAMNIAIGGPINAFDYELASACWAQCFIIVHSLICLFV
jgi:hypothetical protein